MNLAEPELLEGLPGADRVRQGLLDYRHGRVSIPACLVRMARPRLIPFRSQVSSLSPSPTSPSRDTTAEIELYQLVSESQGRRAFGSYQSLVRELISFEHALDHRLARRP